MLTGLTSLNTDLGRHAHEASGNCCAAAQHTLESILGAAVQHTLESILVLETPSLTQSLTLNRLSIRD